MIKFVFIFCNAIIHHVVFIWLFFLSGCNIATVTEVTFAESTFAETLWPDFVIFILFLLILPTKTITSYSSNFD